MTTTSRIGTALVVLAAGAFALAQADGTKLTRQVRAGETQRFKMTAEVDIMGTPALFTATTPRSCLATKTYLSIRPGR